MNLAAPVDASAVARGFDLKRLPADFFDDPFRYYGALREHAPVHRMPDGAYFLTRWRDCDAVYRDANGPSQSRFSSHARSSSAW